MNKSNRFMTFLTVANALMLAGVVAYGFSQEIPAQAVSVPEPVIEFNTQSWTSNDMCLERAQKIHASRSTIDSHRLRCEP